MRNHNQSRLSLHFVYLWGRPLSGVMFGNCPQAKSPKFVRVEILLLSKTAIAIDTDVVGQ